MMINLHDCCGKMTTAPKAQSKPAATSTGASLSKQVSGSRPLTKSFSGKSSFTKQKK